MVAPVLWSNFGVVWVTDSQKAATLNQREYHILTKPYLSAGALISILGELAGSAQRAIGAAQARVLAGTTDLAGGPIRSGAGARLAHRARRARGRVGDLPRRTRRTGVGAQRERSEWAGLLIDAEAVAVGLGLVPGLDLSAGG